MNYAKKKVHQPNLRDVFVDIIPYLQQELE